MRGSIRSLGGMGADMPTLAESYAAETAQEKAKARRDMAAGRARRVDTYATNYVSAAGRLVVSEGWLMERVPAKQVSA